MSDDRNRKKSGKVASKNHRPSKSGKANAKPSGNHAAKRAEKKSAGNAKAAPHITAQSQAAKQAEHEAALIDTAREWARLHANPKTRDRMEGVLNGLSNADKRRVVLCGQRIAGGLSVKLVK